MATVVNSTFKLKRGTYSNLLAVNPILENGEPCFEYDRNKLKIGNGVSRYKDLPYIEGASSLVYVTNKDELPATGSSSLIYKVGNDPTLYQWNSSTLEYEPLGGSGSNIDEIKIINGGKANG